MAAPVIESSATPTFASNADNTITKPSGVVSDDLLVAFAITGQSTSRYLVPPAGGGWTEEISDTHDLTDSNHWIQCWWKIAGGSEPSTYTFTQNTSFTESGLCMYRISGAEDPATTAIVHPTTTAHGASGNADSHSITPTDADSLVIRFAGSSRTPTMSSITGYTDLDDATASGVALATWHKTQGASATGVESFTYTPTWYGSPVFGHIAIAIAPPAAPGGTTRRYNLMTLGVG